MKNIKLISILILVLLFITSCANPFDLKAIEKQVASVAPTTSLKGATNVVSGGSPPVVTSGGYIVTNTMGVLSTLPKVTTAGGYSVSTSLNSD